MPYTIEVPTPGQNISAALYGKAVRDAINDLDARTLVLEGIVIARVAKVKVTADSATWTTGEVQYTTINATLQAGYTYGISVVAAMSATAVSSPSGEAGLCRIREDNVSGTQLAGPQIYLATASTVGFGVQAYAEYTALATANKVFSITGARNGGTNSQQFRAGATRPTLVYIDLIAVP